MKKILLTVFVCLLVVTGCGDKKEEKKDLKAIEKKIVALDNFKKHESVSKDTIEKKYSIDLGDADVLMLASKEYDDASIVFIAEKNDKVKTEVDAFVKSYNDQWVKMNYFPEQKELVEKATYKTDGQYIIYIVSKNNDEVLKIVNE